MMTKMTLASGLLPDVYSVIEWVIEKSKLQLCARLVNIKPSLDDQPTQQVRSRQLEASDYSAFDCNSPLLIRLCNY